MLFGKIHANQDSGDLVILENLVLQGSLLYFITNSNNNILMLWLIDSTMAGHWQ